jgi:hypothetical protein
MATRYFGFRLTKEEQGRTLRDRRGLPGFVVRAGDADGRGRRRLRRSLKGEEGNGRQEQEGQGEGRKAKHCETAAGGKEEERQAAQEKLAEIGQSRVCAFAVRPRLRPVFPEHGFGNGSFRFAALKPPGPPLWPGGLFFRPQARRFFPQTYSTPRHPLRPFAPRYSRGPLTGAIKPTILR